MSPVCLELHSFQLRAHMYQARGLIGSDESGLSDPYARVIFSNASLCTQVIDETLNPTWDETLILNEISVYGTIENIKEQPPVIVVEIFDQDRMVQPLLRLVTLTTGIVYRYLHVYSSSQGCCWQEYNTTGFFYIHTSISLSKLCVADLLRCVLPCWEGTGNSN